LDDGLSLLQSVGVASDKSWSDLRSDADNSYGEGDSSVDAHSRIGEDIRRGESWPFASLSFRRQTQAMQLNLGDPYRQEMINYGNAQYIVRMRVGRSTLAGMPDTGSSELLVFGSNCKTCGVTGRYNPRQSPSSNRRRSKLYSPSKLMMARAEIGKFLLVSQKSSKSDRIALTRRRRQQRC